MNTQQLNLMARNCNVLKKSFTGVYASDMLPIRKHDEILPKSLIANMDSSTEPGSHWICIYIPLEGDCE